MKGHFQVFLVYGSVEYTILHHSNQIFLQKEPQNPPSPITITFYNVKNYHANCVYVERG